MSGRTRDETPQERADRNWNDLLQELRVSQTGVQLLAGFLATLPFQSRFETLDGFQRGWYVGLLALALGTVAVMLAPVAIHRRVFQEDSKPELVQAIRDVMGGSVSLPKDYEPPQALSQSPRTSDLSKRLASLTPQRAKFGEDDADYELTYEVLA